MRTFVMLGLVAVAVSAAGCGWNDDVDSRAATAGLPSIRADIEAHEWLLDRDDSSLTVDDDVPVTLSVNGDTVSGRAPCNTYRGSFELGADGSVEIDGLALTRMACPGSAMEAEDEYVAALEQVDHAEVEVDEDGRDDRDRLVLTGDDGVRLAFRSIDAEDLLVAEWDIVNVATGDAIESVLAGTEPTVTFAADGTVTLMTGCNNAAGEWELDGDEMTIEVGPRTMMACEDPPGLTAQENALVAALDAAARIEIAPGSLTLLDDDGLIVLVAVQE
jgi:heat shock protein HslJ